MIKQWKSPSLEILDTSLTMGSGGRGGRPGGGGGRCGHRGHRGPKKDCPTPEVPPETGIGDS